MDSPEDGVSDAFSVPIGRSAVPVPTTIGTDELASCEATGVVDGDSDFSPDELTWTAPTVTVTVFAAVTVTVAGPHSLMPAVPATGDSVLPPPA